MESRKTYDLRKKWGRKHLLRNPKAFGLAIKDTLDL